MILNEEDTKLFLEDLNNPSYSQETLGYFKTALDLYRAVKERRVYADGGKVFMEQNGVFVEVE